MPLPHVKMLGWITLERYEIVVVERPQQYGHPESHPPFGCPPRDGHWLGKREEATVDGASCKYYVPVALVGWVRRSPLRYTVSL